jgi:hypothetical protein
MPNGQAIKNLMGIPAPTLSEFEKHIVLYAKRHYIRSNLFAGGTGRSFMDDLRRIISVISASPEDSISGEDVENHVIETFVRVCHPSRLPSVLKQLINSCDPCRSVQVLLGDISAIPIRNDKGDIIWDIGKANPKILPLATK